MEPVATEISESIEHTFTQEQPQKEISSSVEHTFEQLPLQKTISSPEFAEFLKEEDEEPQSHLAQIQTMKVDLNEIDDAIDVIETRDKSKDMKEKVVYIVIGAGVALSAIVLFKFVKKLVKKN